MKNLTFLRGERPPGGKGAPIHIFISELLLVNILKCCVSNLNLKFFDFKKSKNPHTERWSQPTAKISVF